MEGNVVGGEDQVAELEVEEEIGFGEREERAVRGPREGGEGERDRCEAVRDGTRGGMIAGAKSQQATGNRQ